MAMVVDKLPDVAQPSAPCETRMVTLELRNQFAPICHVFLDSSWTGFDEAGSTGICLSLESTLERRGGIVGAPGNSQWPFGDI